MHLSTTANTIPTYLTDEIPIGFKLSCQICYLLQTILYFYKQLHYYYEADDMLKNMTQALKKISNTHIHKAYIIF